jgi:cation transport ATPase
VVQDIATTKVVPGDIVLLRGGTVVPADMRIFGAQELSIDEAVLTGENEPVMKQYAVIIFFPSASRSSPRLIPLYFIFISLHLIIVLSH